MILIFIINKGRFLHAKNIAAGGPYNNNFSFPIINLPEPGVYEISYYVFYICDGAAADCRNMNDTITVRINEVITKYEYDELVNNPTWVKKTLKYTALDTQLNVKKIILYIFNSHISLIRI